MKLIFIFLSAFILAELAVADDPPPTTTTTTTTAPVSANVLRGFKACQLRRKNTQPDISRLVKDVKTYSGCY